MLHTLSVSPPPTARCVPHFSFRKVTKSVSSRPPSYASASELPLGKNFKVGKPVTPYRSAMGLFFLSSASMLATMHCVPQA